MVQLVVNLDVESVDLRGCKLPGRDLAFEREIDFGVGSACRLGKTEVGVNDAERARATPEETVWSAMSHGAAAGTYLA